MRNISRIKISSLFACLSIVPLLLVIAPCSSTVSGPAYYDIGDNNPHVILAFGDSITVGLGSTDGSGYRERLEELLLRDGKVVRVIEDGIAGSISQNGVERIRDDLFLYKPAVIIIMYGTNDEYWNISKYTGPETADKLMTRNNLTYMVATARENKTIVVLSTLPPVCGNRRDRQLQNTIEMNNEIRNIVTNFRRSDRGVLLADPFSAFVAKDPENNGCGFIGLGGNHPNNKGYRIMAETFYEVLKELTW